MVGLASGSVAGWAIDVASRQLPEMPSDASILASENMLPPKRLIRLLDEDCVAELAHQKTSGAPRGRTASCYVTRQNQSNAATAT
jgi:hypothetical protein